MGHEVAIEPTIGSRIERSEHLVADFCQTRPNISQVDILTVFAFAYGLFCHVEGDLTSQRKSYDERWAHQEVRLDALVHTRLEIAIATQDTGCDQVVLCHYLLNAGVERTRVANAGRTPVADKSEAELVEIGLQAGLVQVLRHHP